MTVLSYTNALLGRPYPQHKSGQTSVQSYLYPGSLQPQKRAPDSGPVTAAKALLGISYPQHSSGKTIVRSYLYNGAIQPQQSLAQILPFQVEMGQTYRKIAVVAY